MDPRRYSLCRFLMNSESTKARAGYVSQRFSEVAFVSEWIECRDEKGNWYRDTTIEFDSDEEPALEDIVH